MQLLWLLAPRSVVAGSVRPCKGVAGMTVRASYIGLARILWQCCWRGISPATLFSTTLSTCLWCLVLHMKVKEIWHSRRARAYALWDQDIIDELHVWLNAHQAHHLGAGQESFIQLCRPIFCPINSFSARASRALQQQYHWTSLARLPCRCKPAGIHVWCMMLSALTSMPDP